ncbi:CST complex subunit STN1-like isoform X2 [Dreissena polymorpha]|uniref:CST complex subunit STN1-like isoform X2 n=1 Tax=Dreissena polymorpha TaxID=45954 RepID=UPI0022654DE0|nr:CST complex subunit STN1-like isoform X2 [Dreissena polymorpha]
MNCSDQCQVHPDLEFYPPKTWGLEFHFGSYKKLYIADIVEMKPYPHFTVDDGTGVILCCTWKDSYNKTNTPINKTSLPDCLREKLISLETQTSLQEQGYQLGDLVHIKGKLKIFREKMEVVATYHVKVEDPNIQLFRMNELPRIYQQCYNRPFQLPLKVQQALSRGSTRNDGKPEQTLTAELKTILHQAVCNTDQVLMTVDDFQKYDRVKEFLSAHCEKSADPLHSRQVMVANALSLMEDEGHVVRRSDQRNLYELLYWKSKLEDAIRKVLVTECAKPKYAEKGCHYLHILTELQNTLAYSKLKKVALVFCLDKLESQSDVIRTTQAHYMLL